MKRIKSILRKIKIRVINFLLPFQLLKYLLDKREFNRVCDDLNIHYLDDVETVNQIINDNKSLSRFGDGELLWLIGFNFKSYQKGSLELSNRLKEVILSSEPNLLIGVPGVYNKDLYGRYTLKAKMHWAKFSRKHLPNYRDFLTSEKQYADTQISRCYIDYKCKSFAREKYTNLKRIWEKKEVVIVEGSKSKVGLGNDLLSNATSVKRIICPAFDAFDKYDEILDAVKEHCEGKLTILALGPTATILAYDIAKLNVKGSECSYQAIDLGHFDIEYEWYKAGVMKRTPIKGKYVNEVADKDMPNNSLDREIERAYENSIICKVL